MLSSSLKDLTGAVSIFKEPPHVLEIKQYIIFNIGFIYQINMIISIIIKLLESPIPAPPPTATPSQKAHFDNISGTKRGSIDPLVSKRPEKNSE